MKIAVIGGGGREHALVRTLKQSPDCGPVVALPGNAGIAQDAECVPIKPTDIASIVDYCIKNSVDYVVVAPDDPLALGMVDALAQAGVPAFGPSKAAARIEASKVFAKRLMQRHGIPTADFEVFGDVRDALAYVRDAARPLVVKADGLALGKGVFVCRTPAEADTAVRQLMERRLFGQSGARVVVEECLSGPEVSVLAFCDGARLAPMVSSMDHKRAGDGDTGPNTGGMGAVAPNPFYTAETAARCMREIFLPTVRAMAAEGAPFKGCLYFGLMLTPGGPKVIEYNCRFGDPETQAVLPLLKGDLLKIMLACTHGSLREEQVRFSPRAAVSVVLASGGYPGPYAAGLPITGIEAAEARPCVSVTHAGTARVGGALVTAGGRVLNVTATAPSPAQALDRAYRAARCIRFEGMAMRGDIGRAALAANRD